MAFLKINVLLRHQTLSRSSKGKEGLETDLSLAKSPWSSTRDDTWQSLETFLVVRTAGKVEGVCYSHLVGRGHECC